MTKQGVKGPKPGVKDRERVDEPLPGILLPESQETCMHGDSPSTQRLPQDKPVWTSWDEYLADRELAAVPDGFLADRDQPANQTRVFPR